MTNQDIIDRLVVEVGLNRAEARDLVELLFADIRERVTKGERVRLIGLGALFIKKQYYQRKRRDIELTPEDPNWQTVSFSVSSKLKARIQRALIELRRENAKDQEAFTEYQEQLCHEASQTQAP